MLLTEERMCTHGKVLDHRQCSAFFLKINNWRLLRYKLKKRVLNQGRQQLVFNESFFISDNCFTNIQPGKIPTCGSQSHMQLQKLRCIYDCINTYPPKFQHLPESTFSIAIKHPRRIVFSFCSRWADVWNHGLVFHSWCIYCLDFSLQVTRSKPWQLHPARRRVTVVQKGLLRIECLIAPVRTQAGAKPDGPWMS